MIISDRKKKICAANKKGCERKEKFDIHVAPAKAGLHTAKIGQGSQKMQIPLANSEDPNCPFHLFS